MLLNTCYLLWTVFIKPFETLCFNMGYDVDIYYGIFFANGGAYNPTPNFHGFEILSLEWGWWWVRGRVVMCSLADTAIQGSAAATARRHEHCGGFPQPRQRWSSGSSECGVSQYTTALGAGPHPQQPRSTQLSVNNDKIEEA